MPTKQKIVTEFLRDELWWIVDAYKLPVDDRRRLDHLYAAVRRLPKSELRGIMLNFERDRLKEICRALELDDSGRQKSEIVARLLGVDDPDEEDPPLIVRPTSAPVFNSVPVLHATAQVGGYSAPQPPSTYPTSTPPPGAYSTSSIEPSGSYPPAPGSYATVPTAGYPTTPPGGYPTPPPTASAPSPIPTPRVARPRLFIGSTVESNLVARWVQAELDYEFEVTLWSQSLFTPGDWTWSRLVEMARVEFDFALLVFSGDDVVESRGAPSLVPRDNLLLEYGLFVGALGVDRTFFLYNRDHRPRIASDLAGVTALTYGDRDDGNVRAAVGPACTSLIERRTRLGRLDRT